jgi:alanine racemase
MMAVVKAGAYGHGVLPVAKSLNGSVEMFGVANVAEAWQVRTADANTPIFILAPALPDERREIVDGGFIPTVSDLGEAKAYAALATDKPLPVHLALDTGMGRIGIWQDDVIPVVWEIAALKELEVCGVASHLPVADEDPEFTREQLGIFHRLAGKIRDIIPGCRLVHVANSAGAIAFGPQVGDMVRAGLALYGSSPIPEFQLRLRPVLTWKTRVTLVREVGAGRSVSYGRTYITAHPMKIATLAVGYADGFQRHLSNQGAEVLIGGCRCPLLGRVTMDQIMVNVTDVPDVEPGTEAVLIGSQGAEEILAAEMAQKAGTIPWEIFTGLGPRVVRVAA